MTRLLSIGFLLLIPATSCWACRHMTPDPDHLDEYGSIFLGQITGIRLMGHELELLATAPTCDSARDGDDMLECINPSAGAQTVVTFSVPTRVFQGSATGVQTLEIAGCSYLRGNIGDTAIFFARPGSNSAIMVWKSERKDYAEWLKRLQRIDTSR